MTNWEDYAIYKVRYDSDDDHIEKVKVFEVNESLNNLGNRKREWVVEKDEDGYDFITTIKKDNGKWKPGEDIHVLDINGEKFIRTDRNEEETDNLGDLPEF